MNYLAFAEDNLRREYGQAKRYEGQTHWSPYDAPYYALCGQPISPEQFNRNPSCPVCRQKLQEEADADLR